MCSFRKKLQLLGLCRWTPLGHFRPPVFFYVLPIILWDRRPWVRLACCFEDWKCSKLGLVIFWLWWWSSTAQQFDRIFLFCEVSYSQITVGNPAIIKMLKSLTDKTYSACYDSISCKHVIHDNTLVSYCKQFDAKTYKYAVINKPTNTASNNIIC